MLADPLFYLLAIPAVVLLGLAKGGFAGMGALTLPLLVLVISPLQAAAILLPILIVQDIVSVTAFRRTWDGHVLAWTLPGALIGVAIGYAFAASVTPEAVMGAVGAIAMLFGGYRLYSARRGAVAAVRSPGWVGAIAGTAAGFTSQVAHAGGPPFQLWVLPRQLPRDVLVGTSAIFFATVNWVKVPAYWTLGQFTRENLLTAAVLLPVAAASTMAGVWLVRRVPFQRFYTVIYVLMVVVGAKLILDAL